jgi:hypothetical protein
MGEALAPFRPARRVVIKQQAAVTHAPREAAVDQTKEPLTSSTP